MTQFDTDTSLAMRRKFSEDFHDFLFGCVRRYIENPQIASKDDLEEIKTLALNLPDAEKVVFIEFLSEKNNNSLGNKNELNKETFEMIEKAICGRILPLYGEDLKKVSQAYKDIFLKIKDS
ncbi:hypothetical protein [Holospora obtusa]|nr:hypothetical protein [Holospora obtusa]